MEGELQERRDLVTQLKADNERLQREHVATVPDPAVAGPSTASATSSLPSTTDGRQTCFPLA